jgi:hypothetical protein
MPVPVKDKAAVAPLSFVKVALPPMFGDSKLGYQVPV